MNLKERIDDNISFVFFFASLILICLKYYDYLSKDFLSTATCLFLILTIGISHGALDDVKGHKILKFYKIINKLLFYFTYIFIASFIILLWIFLPTLMLILFLIISAYHFGKEDSWGDPIKKSALNPLKFFLKGSLIIWVPLWLSFNETLIIFDILNIKDKEFYNFLDILHGSYLLLALVIISLLSNLLITRNPKQLTGLFIDIIAIVALYDSFNPLIAFTIYFCFLHSVRHSASLINELKINLNDFIKRALPLTFLAAFFYLIALYILTEFQKVNISSAIINVIFIGLASLTFPHILLEYLLKKNEK